MSIAEDEAEKAYPTRYWGETHVKKQFYCDTDDLQEAYLLGRNAPPADAWNYAGGIPGFHEGYIRQAKELLALARKAVNE